MDDNKADLTLWNDAIAQERDDFINELIERGYRLTRDKSLGSSSDAKLEDGRVEIRVIDGFPYVQPTVRAIGDVPRTWHQSPNGDLCLYASRDRDNQPWRDADSLLARVDLWFEKNEQGWPDDPPALDIEAYLDLPIDTRYVMYDDLSTLSDDYIEIRADQRTLRVIGPGKVPKKSTKGILSGYVTDLGELTTPPLNWHDLITNVAEPERIQSAIERDRIDVLLIRYQRGNQHGAVAITLTGAKGQDATPRFALSGSSNQSVMRLRAGSAVDALANKHVYVVGAGALGSHICDGLARAGIGRMTVRDFDILSPGNTTRHLVTTLSLCGTNKATLVKVVLDNRPYNRAVIVANPAPLASPAEAAELLDAYDLVVDATADGAVTSMLEDAARATGRRFITACLQNEGRTQRADIVPPYDAATPHPPTVHQPPNGLEMFEAGCGEPISRTPPHAVAEAAAMTVRHVIGMLTGDPECPAGEVRNHT